VRGSRIACIGAWRELSGQEDRVIDLGDVLLLPGLVNAHCHLDYTQMAGQFPPPGVFTDWLKTITETKAGWEISDYKASWKAGAAMLLATGTTTVVDIEAVPQLLPQMWDCTPLRVFSLLEMISITNRRSPAVVLQEAMDKLLSLRHPRCHVGLSPHAPYSTVPELLRLSGRTARRRGWLVSTHVAESALEFEMFKRKEGTMFDWLRRSGRDMSDCGMGSPIGHLERSGLLGRNLLAAHVNYLGRSDLSLLSRRGASVVHCPRSHAYFRHDNFPLGRLTRAGVNVCLGTDSLASVCQTRREPVELNMFDEMRTLAGREPGLSSRKLIQLATWTGARALGMEDRLGHFSPGAFADIIAIPLKGNPADLYEAVLQHRGAVAASMIGGAWVLPPKQPSLHRRKARGPAGRRAL
jgi:cytosine/adenosine deaminase-related metal-dependent hydrolase